MAVVVAVSCLAAGCATAPVRIPRASPTASPRLVRIAPGVTVNAALLQLPPYSVSPSNPLPTGVSPRRVVRDLIVDNLVENAALVRNDVQLLPYADTGGVLALDRNAISNNEASRTRVLRITDLFASLEVGTKADPNDAAASIAVIVQDYERTTRSSTGGHRKETAEAIDELVWMLWSPSAGRYLECDVSNSV